ncbi:MAG: NAD-dependent epimerase/dehydratase family protein [Marinoscillum sp.]
MSNNTALIAGSSGLVGSSLVNQLINDNYYQKVIVLTRRPLGLTDPKVEEVVVEDFDTLASAQEQLIAQDYFCCLGTTIKQAGSKEQFKKVDLEYPLELARIAQKSPSYKHFLIVTAAGANADSPLFYNQVKGEVEEQLRAMKISGLKVFRPSLLLGDRRDFRLGEEIAKFVSNLFSFFMVGLKRKLWSIKASDVAKSMLLVAKEQRPGYRVYNSNDMIKRISSFGF